MTEKVREQSSTRATLTCHQRKSAGWRPQAQLVCSDAARRFFGYALTGTLRTKAYGLEAATRRIPTPRALSRRTHERPDVGFTLVEVITALAILALASSSVLIVIDRCVSSASNSALRLEAFELARENLEKILISDTAEESVDYGTSDKYPDISWQTIVEGFPEPVTGQMWVRAVCSAEYIDSTGEKRTVELVHWLSPLTEQQVGMLVDQQELEKLGLEQLLKTDEEAAGYAKIDTDTLRKWVENGLVKTRDGMFLKYNLDVFIEAKGNPTPEQKAEQVESVQKLAVKLKMQEKEPQQEGSEQKGPTGPSNRKPEKLSPDQIRDLVNPESRLK